MIYWGLYKDVLAYFYIVLFPGRPFLPCPGKVIPVPPALPSEYAHLCRLRLGMRQMPSTPDNPLWPGLSLYLPCFTSLATLTCIASSCKVYSLWPAVGCQGPRGLWSCWTPTPRMASSVMGMHLSKIWGGSSKVGIISPHFDWLSDGVLVSVIRGYSGHSSSSGLSKQIPSHFPSGEIRAFV